MTVFSLITIVFAASVGINLVAWLRYAMYGGAFKSNLIIGISTTILTFIVAILGIAAFINAYDWYAFWLCFGTLAIPTASSWFFATREDQ